MHRELGEHREGGAHSRLGVEMGQRGKAAWLGFETYIEVGEGRKQRSSLCMVRSMGRMEFKGV